MENQNTRHKTWDTRTQHKEHESVGRDPLEAGDEGVGPGPLGGQWRRWRLEPFWGQTAGWETLLGLGQTTDSGSDTRGHGKSKHKTQDMRQRHGNQIQERTRQKQTQEHNTKNMNPESWKHWLSVHQITAFFQMKSLCVCVSLSLSLSLFLSHTHTQIQIQICFIGMNVTSTMLPKHQESIEQNKKYNS